MAKNKKSVFLGGFYLLFIGILLFQGCASMQQPQGGPKDSLPPTIVEETPKNLTRNFNAKRITIVFDEYFKLNNEYNEITVSPSQEIPPLYKIKQKSLEIELKDTLEANTTYTINFGKAVGDVNENNLLKNYTYVFSTGDEIDSLQISGKVINSADNKPVLDATVFILPIDRDTLFGKKKASLFTTTDSSGNFRLRNLKEQAYKIYALKEEGGDKIYNSTKEQIAFLKDSIYLDSDTSGIQLTLFYEIPDNYRVLDKKIEKDGKISIVHNKGIENPSVRFLEPANEDAVTSFSKNADTTSIWMKNMEFDSLKVVHLNGNEIIDTVTIKRNKRDTYERNILFSSNLVSGKIKPRSDLLLTFNTPLQGIDKSKILVLQDSLPIRDYTISGTEPTNRTFKISYPWKIEKIYTIQFQENALTDIYGTKNKEMKGNFELDEIENYGNLELNFVRSDTSKYYIVQLLTENGNVYKESVLEFNSIIPYKLIENGKYKVKVIEDTNKNGKFDTGNVKRKEQPEKSWFYDKDLVIRPNWDQEEKIVIPKDF